MEKVQIIPLGLEYDRVLYGINLYGVSKLYIIRGLSDFESHVEPFVDKLKERYSELVTAGAFKETRIDITDIGQIYSAIHTIMGLESENQMYFNISAATKLLAIGTVLSVWCFPLDKLKNVPVIYYIIPKEYAHVNLIELEEVAKDMWKNYDDYIKRDPEAIRSFIKEILDTSSAAKSSGISRGKPSNFVVEIPHMPIKAPFGLNKDILEILKTYGGEFDSVEKLVNAFLKDRRGITDPKKLKAAYKRERGRINYHLTELDNMGMIEKIRRGKKTRIKITSLGEVFAS